MGGIIFDTFSPMAHPVVCRTPFPQEITNRLVSFDNPTGNVTNSDLELAGVIAGHDVSAAEIDLRHQHLVTLCDNMPAVAWKQKGFVSRIAPVSFLLRIFALHRRFYRYTSSITHLARDLNQMADDASSRWDLIDNKLLAYFISMYPQPTSWTLSTLQPETSLSLISALSKTLPSDY